MCVWTGYLGSRPAAQEVFSMLQRIEGLWSGFYTGIAALDSQGCLRHAKTVGYTRQWLDQFQLSAYPGSLALAHSRTNSGGGREWSHPFIREEAGLALVAQGSAGMFAGEKVHRETAGSRLLAAGRQFNSAVPKRTGRYPVLADGTEVHGSEVVAAVAAEAYLESGDHGQAVAKAGASLLSEAIYVMFFQDCPDVIWLSNVNQRCVVGYAPGEVFLSTTVLAFPERVQRIEEVPANVMASVRVSGMTCQTLSERCQDIAEPPDALEEPFLAYLAENPGALLGHVVDNALKPLYPGDGLRRASTAGYRTLEKLVHQGKIDFVNSEFENKNGTIGMVTRLSLKK